MDNQLNNAKHRYLVSLGFEVAFVASLIALLIFLNLKQLPITLAKARQTEAFSVSNTIKQDLTVSFYETNQWPVATTYNNSRDNYLGSYVHSIHFDGQGGLHIKFSAADANLNGKTLSIIAATSVNTVSGNMIWICGFRQAPEGYQLSSKNLTNISNELAYSICRDI